MQQVRDDRDHQLLQVHGLSVELVSYKELTGKTSMELDTIMTTTTALEVGLFFYIIYSCFWLLVTSLPSDFYYLQATCSSQKERIKVLESQLETANEKLKVSTFMDSAR